MKRIIVAGGGIGGTIIANRLAEKLMPELKSGDVQIVVLDKSDKHVYQPGQVFVGLGLSEPTDIVKEEKELLNPHVKFLHGQAGEMTKIDVANHSVVTADGKDHRYDYLVISTGSHNAWDEIPGLRESEYSPWDFDSALKMREAVSNFSGGTVVVNVAKLPHKCPVGPLELTLMFDDMMRRRGIRDKTKIIYTFPQQGVFGIPTTNKVMLKIFEERGIEVHSPFNVKAVDPKEKVIESNEGEKIKFDLLMGVPPNVGAKVIGDSGIGDRRNWVPTDKFTLRMKDHSDVYVMGDTTDIPISKAGSTADFESYVVANNLTNDIRGNAMKKNYDGSVFCYIATGLDTATYIRFNYNYPPVPPPPSYVHWWGKIMYNKMYWTITAKAIV